MPPSLHVVTVKNRRPSAPVHYPGKFPRQIGGIAQTRHQALANKWRRNMCRISNQKHPTFGKLAHATAMESIHCLALDLHRLLAGPGTQEFAHGFIRSEERRV